MNPSDSETERPRPETESTSKPKDSKTPSASTGSSVGLFGWRDVDQSIGPYSIIALLGHGGQATVYRALDRRVDRTVALKVLRGGGGGDLLRRFRREAEVTARLDHPSICPIYEVGLDGVPFIAMKLIEGETLAQHLSSVRSRPATPSSDKSSFVDLQVSTTEPVARIPDPPPRPAFSPSSNTPHDRAQIFGVLRLVEQIARALHVAHEAGIIHRDIKPGNLMIQKDGTPVILDFGLAYQEDHAGPSLSETGQILGTPAYMAPEQLAAKPMRVDRRADIYSLGVTLYECLTLRRPFDAPSRAALYHAIACEAPPDPRKLNAALSADVRVVLLKALEKDPIVRFQTALDFAEELRRVCSFEPIRTRPVGALTRHVRWVQRNPGWAVALYGIVVALSLAVAVFALKNAELDRANTDLRIERKALARKTSEANALAEVATANARTAEANATRAGENAARAESESAAKGLALQEKSKALEERTKAVEDYDRLADSTLLAQATVEADRLYPIAPALLERIAVWQDRYGPLFGRLMEHEATLAALRRLAAPYTAADRAADYPDDAANVAALEARATAARSKADAAPSSESLVEAAEDLEDELKAAKAAYIAKAPRSPDFGGDVRLRFKHDVLAKLVQDLRAFTAEKIGTRADVELRKRRSELIRKETIEDQAKAWAEVAARVATNPRYEGLKIAPQLGLIPLGPDPTSTLEEFLDWRTHDGAIPRREGNAPIRVEETTGLVFVLIPSGTYMRGAQKQDAAKPNFDPDARDDESPVRSQVVEAFFMSKYEMTQGQWRRAPSERRSPSYYGKGWQSAVHDGGRAVDLRHPVEQISWDEARLVFDRLTIDFPTEAQWEYAARAGAGGRWADATEVAALARFSNISGLESEGHFSNLSPEHRDPFLVHAPVGSFEANRFGLHDMIGNVYELCLDPSSYALTPSADERGGAVKKTRAGRIGRGGSFGAKAEGSRVAFRRWIDPSFRIDYLGVRPARAIGP